MATVNLRGLKIVSVIIKLLGVLPLLIGLGLLTGAWFAANRQYTIVKKWPSVDAEVARSGLTHHQETFGQRHIPTTVYQAQIEFRYAVGGKQYTTPAGASYSTSNYAEMKQKVDTYALGTHHSIRYDPTNPNNICYDAGYTLSFFLAPLILGVAGLMSTAIGAAAFFIGTAMGKTKVRCPSCGAMVGYTEPSCPMCGAALAQSSAGR